MPILSKQTNVVKKSCSLGIHTYTIPELFNKPIELPVDPLIIRKPFQIKFHDHLPAAFCRKALNIKYSCRSDISGVQASIDLDLLTFDRSFIMG